MSRSERAIAQLEAKNAEQAAELRKLRHLLKKTLGAGRVLESESGVNENGEAFVHLRWGDELGQVTSDEAKMLGQRLIETAAAADFDAAFLAAMTTREDGEPLSMDQALLMLSLVRDHRHGDSDRSGGSTGAVTM